MLWGTLLLLHTRVCFTFPAWQLAIPISFFTWVGRSCSGTQLNELESWLVPTTLWLWVQCFKECGMGPLLVLVSPCFRENVVATCKIGSFLCSLDNLLQKNVVVLFFGNQISKWCSFEKWAIFDLLFTFSSHQGKVTKIPWAHISNTYIHVFCSPCWLFLPYQFWKKKIRIYQVRFLFGMSLGVDSYSHHFGTINK